MEYILKAVEAHIDEVSLDSESINGNLSSFFRYLFRARECTVCQG